MAHLAGTVIPLPTPFDEGGEVDENTFRQVIDFELDAEDYGKRKITCPTLALFGRGLARLGALDVWREWCVDVRGAGLPCGHFLPEEAPDATSAALRTGCAITGPSPWANDRPRPSGSNGSKMSANRMAASTPRRSTGWSVTSAARSGRRQISKSEARSRMARYSAK